MAPGAHLIFSWLTTVELFKFRRERALLTFAGLAPDVDGVGFVVDRLTGNTSYYVQYHHVVGHGLFAAMVISLLTYALAQTQRVQASLFAFVLVHLHILLDLVGSRSSDGYQWPIHYLFPFSNEPALAWSGQWPLNAVQNHIFMFLCGLACVYYLHTRRVSFFEVFHPVLNSAVVRAYERLVHKSA